MDEEKQKKIQEARREYEAAANELRALQGKNPIYDLSNNEFSMPAPPICSFCGKGVNQVRRMLPGNDAHICNECILVCLEIIEGS